MVNQKFKNNVMLVLTALIWGSAFVAQSVGMDYIGPFTFNSLRCLLGGIVLLPVIWVMGRKKKTAETEEQRAEAKKSSKTLWIGGLFCGLALAVASSLQQIGLVYTSAGKAGFITVFSLHILIIDYYSPKADGVKLSCIQFFICGILCAVPMFVSENPDLGSILDAYLPLLYAGVLSCGVAYTLQIIAQKNTDPTVASLILSLESVFAALTGWLIIHETLSAKELFGCALVFAAIILAQLPEKAPAWNEHPDNG